MPRGIPNKAKDSPVFKSSSIDAQEYVVQPKPRVMKSTGRARDSLESNGVQVCDRPVDEEKLAMLAFMEEPVTIHIHTTSDKAAEQVFEVFNNGQRQVFRRGETKTVPRKFVNELAMRKEVTYTDQKTRDREGVQQYVYQPNSALRYPFSVVEDKHPRGADWLKATLAMN